MKTPKRSYYNQKRSFSKRILIIPIVVICLLVLMFFQWTRIQLAFKGYSLTEQNMILKLDDEEIKSFLNNDKINSLESWNELENENHYQEYAYYQKLHSQLSKKDVIAYIDTFYQKYYDKLKELNYSDDVLCQMMKKAQLSDFEYITKQNLNYQQTKSYLDITGVIYTDLKAYIDSQKQPLEAVLSISYPFINSQNKVNRTYQIINPDSLATIIKKGFQIASDYIPNDLVTPNIIFSQDCTNRQLRKEASEALELMAQDASKENLHLAIKSAYRSYQEQKDIYDEYHQKYDQVTADSLVAIPGSSEHQLGLGVDLTSQSVIDGEWRFFGDTPEYKWVVANAHRYGYILRYPSHNSKMTGTTNEPWHFRYVGKEIAKIIHDNNWTLEEYVLHYGLGSDCLITK